MLAQISSLHSLVLHHIANWHSEPLSWVIQYLLNAPLVFDAHTLVIERRLGHVVHDALLRVPDEVVVVGVLRAAGGAQARVA